MNIYEKLRTIPWLELDFEIDQNQLVHEYLHIARDYGFVNYHTNYKLARNWYAKSWSGIGLVSSDGGLYTDLHEGDIVNNTDRFEPTLLTHSCPYMYSIIRGMNGGDLKSRCRIMRIAPRRSLIWHSHVLEHGQPENIITVQIPINMPPNFDYCVVDSEEFKWYKRLYKPSWFKSLKKGRLEPGKAYYFNSYNYHNVYNNSDEYRATIMLYLDLMNPVVYNMVMRSIAKAEV